MSVSVRKGRIMISRPYTLGDYSLLFVKPDDETIWFRLPVLDPRIYSATSIARIMSPLTEDDILAIRMDRFGMAHDDPAGFLKGKDALAAAMNFIYAALSAMQDMLTERKDREGVLEEVFKIGFKLWATLEFGARQNGRMGAKEFALMSAADGSINVSTGVHRNIAAIACDYDLFGQAKFFYPQLCPRELVTIIWEPTPQEFITHLFHGGT